MHEHTRVEFRTPDRDHERQFLRTYLLDAVERFSELDDCESAIFIRAGDGPVREYGGAILDVYGDFSVVEHERDTWDSLVADGPLTEWQRHDTDLPTALETHYGESGARLHEELRELATEMARPAYETFETVPAAVETFPEEDGAPVGWYLLVHQLATHAGLSHEAEIDACVRNLTDQFEERARDEGCEAALDQLDDVISRLETTRKQLRADSNGESDDGE